mgnify:CR=1 FL=1
MNCVTRTTHITYPTHQIGASAHVVTFDKDAVGRNEKATLTLTHEGDATPSTYTLVKDVEYEPFGGIRSMTHGDVTNPNPYGTDGATLTTTFGRDRAYRIEDIEVVSSNPSEGVVMRWHLDYDATGNIIERHDDTPFGPPPGTASAHDRTFTYDSLSRLTSSIDANGFGREFGYDANGNRTSEVHLELSGRRNEFEYDYALGTNRLAEKWSKLDGASGFRHSRSYIHYATGHMSRWGTPSSANSERIDLDPEGRMRSYERGAFLGGGISRTHKD